MQLFHIFRSFLLLLKVSPYFSVSFGDFQTFWKNFEIQDDGSKIAAAWTSWRNCHVIWRYHPTWLKPKDKFSDLQCTLWVSLLLFKNSGSYGRGWNPPPSLKRTIKARSELFRRRRLRPSGFGAWLVIQRPRVKILLHSTYRFLFGSSELNSSTCCK